MSHVVVSQHVFSLFAAALVLSAPTSALAGQWTERPLHGDFTPGEPVAVDLDQDGFDDVVVGTTRGVLLVTQQGGDLTATELVAQTSSAPARITFDDFDGDGDLDMASAHRPAGDYVIKLYDNTGVGFVGAGDVPNTRDYAAFLTSGDVDGDGDADLLYYNRWHENLNGSWIYHAAPCHTGQLVDVDLDGDPDVLCSGTSLSWYSNDGTGVFVGPTYIDADDHLRVHPVDMDGDGDLDILTTGDGGQVQFVENLGAAVYATTLVDALPSGDDVDSVAAVDVDRDGLLDIVSSTDTAAVRMLRWYAQLPGGGFGPAADLGVPGGSAIAIDVDHDGADEIVVTNSSFILGAELDDQPASLSILPAAFSGVGLELVDLDGDGSDEILTQTAGLYGAVTVDALWNGGFRHVFTSALPTYYQYSLGDLHSDGIPDLIGTRDTHLVHIYEIPQAPGAPTQLELDLGAPSSARQTGTGDLDGDGDIDLIVEAYYPYYRHILWFEALGAGQMAPPQVLEASTPSSSSRIELIDLDNDGDHDLVLWAHTALAWMENLGGGALAPRQNLIAGPGERRFLDHDGDGDLDVVAANTDANTVVLYDNDGAAVFTPSAMLLLAVDCGGMQAGDVDVDGDIDVVCYEYVSNPSRYRVTFYENTGANQLAAGMVLHERTYALHLNLADVDHDGDLDILVRGINSTPLTVIENGFVDTDGDGVSDANDCAPADPLRRPGAMEVCNGLDDDCDGHVPAIELDADGDTFKVCEGDCDDSAATTFPGAPEICGDGLDNDCDGAPVDDELDFDGDGQATCEGDCDDTAPSVYLGAPELCGNGVDDDCDGTLPLDEIDLDGDGWAICEGDCNDTNGLVYPGAPELCADGLDSDCDGTPPVNELDMDGDGLSACAGDCDDFDAVVHPGALELCDGVDQDCDLLIDEGAPDVDVDGLCDALDPCPFDPLDDSDGDGFCDGVDLCVGNDLYGDADLDGFCEDGLSDVCLGDDASGDADSDGHCAATVAGAVHDCNDSDSTVYPGAIELCDGKDNACAGALPAEDADGDGDGFAICDGDCDDAVADRFPANPEVCDGLDNDCDGTVPLEELDIDGDGVSACAGDCDPIDATTWPGADEVCDGNDNNCDGSVAPSETDADGDAFLVCAGDCDDADPAARPGNPEACDGIDNDCDGMTDEGCPLPQEEPEPEPDDQVGEEGGCNASGAGASGSLALLSLLLLARRRERARGSRALTLPPVQGR